MRLLLALLLLPALVQAAEVQTCPGIAPNSFWTACTKVVCASPTSNEDMVQTQTGGGKYWVKLGTVPATGMLARCAAVNGNWWASRQALGIANPPTPSPPPAPPVVAVSIGDVLHWTAAEGATAYRIYHATTPGGFGPPTEVQGTRYALKGYAPGTHYFAVSAVYPTGESAKSTDVPRYDVPQPSAGKLVCGTPVVSGLSATVSCTLQ